MGTPNRHFYCFGSFRLSATEGVLRRESQQVSLGLKAIETLLVLIRNRQRVVSRDELMKAVWPETVVEENNLEQQIAALRKALGQGQTSTVYIETVPKRGYRFLPDVTEEWDKPSRDTRKSLWILVAACVAVLVGAGWFIRSRIRIDIASHPTGQHRRSVAVLGFKNLSGAMDSAWLSTALTEMLRSELSVGKKLRTISGEEVASTKLDLSVPDAASLSGGTLAAIRRNLGADIALLGSYVVIGQGAKAQVRLDIVAQNTTTGEVTASVTRTAPEATLLDTITEIGATLRKDLGENELTATEAKALKNGYPLSLDAERLYAEGIARLRLLDAVGARPLFEKAIALAPNYALAYSALADVWSVLGYPKNAQEAARKAFDLGSALPREPFLLIEGQFRELANDSDRAIQIYQSLWTVFPDNFEYGLRLANAQTVDGKGKEALVTIQELRKLGGADDPRIDLSEASAAESLGNFKLEQSAASQAATKAEVRGARLLAAAALLRESWARNQLGDRKPAFELAEKAKAICVEVGDRAGEARAWKNVADVLDDEGDSTSARDAYGRALATFREIGHEAAVATVLNNLAYGLMDKGDLDGAKKMFEDSVAISRKIADRGREALALNGVADVVWRQGDLVGALKVFEDVLQIHRERGDQARTATVLGNVAIVLQDQGHLDEAKAKFEESLAIIRHIGDKPGLARTLGNLGELLLRQGDLPSAKSRFSEHLSVAEEMDDNRQRGYALFGLGEVLMAEGDLTGARARHESGLAVRGKMGAKSLLAESHLALAELSLEEGKVAETIEHAREAGQEFHREQEVDQESLAIAIEARAMFSQHLVAQAEKRAKHLSDALPKIQDRAQRLAILVTIAPILAAGGAIAEVKSYLSAAEAEATQLGYGGLRLEVLFAESEVDPNSPGTVPRLQAVEREAKAMGFGLIASKAATRLAAISK